MSKYATLPAFSGNISSTTQAGTYPSKDKVFSESVVEFVLQTAKDAVWAVSRLSENWDGNGSAKPDSFSVQRGISLLGLLYSNVQNSVIPWRPPHVSASENGDVTFEWWCKERKLTMYVGVTSTQFIRIWGPDIDSEMDDGELSGKEFEWLWLWLHNLNADA